VPTVKKKRDSRHLPPSPATPGTDDWPPFVTPHSQGCGLSLWIQPRASRDAVCGIQGEALKLSLTAPPVEGRANDHCLAFLAKRLGLPKSSLELIGGQANRAKRVLVRLDQDADPFAIRVLSEKLLTGTEH